MGKITHPKVVIWERNFWMLQDLDKVTPQLLWRLGLISLQFWKVSTYAYVVICVIGNFLSSTKSKFKNHLETTVKSP